MSEQDATTGVGDYLGRPMNEETIEALGQDLYSEIYSDVSMFANGLALGATEEQLVVENMLRLFYLGVETGAAFFSEQEQVIDDENVVIRLQPQQAANLIARLIEGEK